MKNISPLTIRIALAAFSAGLTLLLGVVVWIMLGTAQGDRDISQVLLGNLGLVMLAAFVAQVIYALKGQIFEFDGSLARREILFAIICFQVIMQFSFGFSVYAVNQTELHSVSYNRAYAHFVELQGFAESNDLEAFRTLNLEENMPECVDRVFLAEHIADYSPRQYYRFPLRDGSLLMRKSTAYFNGHLQSFAISLVMSLVISIILMAEVVYLAVRLINNRIEKMLAGDEEVSEIAARNANPISYLRQLAFLFYFAGFFGASFIPLMARDFAGENPGADFIAGLPYSVEALFNCIAILLTPRLFRAKGWKPLYLVGVAIFIVGLVSSALSPNVFAFIASRAVVGIGYGFCWMILRNIATLDDDQEKRSANFAGLSAGIYAGIMCGVAFGAVLADLIAFRYVLLISAGMVLITSAFPLSIKNIFPKEVKSSDVTGSPSITLSARDIMLFVAFLAVIVIPVSITDAFSAFLLPVYVNSLSLPTSYIGQVSLIYNLSLVYISTSLLLKFVQRLVKNPWFANVIHVLIACIALIVVAHLGGFMAVLLAGMLFGLGDGFGFAIQNSFILGTNVSKKLGIARTLTLFSLFKKFVAMSAPIILGLFIATDGFRGLATLAIVFAALTIAGTLVVSVLRKGEIVR